MPSIQDGKPRATQSGVMHLFATDKYTDITEKFKQDAAKLKPSQIANAPDFTLYQAISAFELGNPKMDTGLEYTLFEEDFKTLEYPKTPTEICSAIDSLFCREVAWLKGATLVQTVFSGLFVESELQTLKNPTKNQAEYVKNIVPADDLLKVYVLATLKSCKLVIDKMLMDDAAIISIDEDFHINTAGWSILDEVNPLIVLELLGKAIAHCGSKPEYKELSLRFQLRSEILEILSLDFNQDSKRLDTAQKLLTQLVPAEQNDKLFGKGIQARSDWFCLQRPLVTMEFSDAKSFMSSLFENIKQASVLTSIQKSADLLGFFLNFAKEDHTPLLRIMVKHTVQRKFTSGPPPHVWVERDITELSYPAFQQNKDTIVSSCKTEWDAFMLQAPLCYMDLISCLCVNKGRRRQSLFEAVATWDSLHVAAQALDRAVVKAGIGATVTTDGKQSWAIEFSSWVYQRKLQIMLWSFLMGFEQELFSPWENVPMYWYAKNLSGVLVEQLTRLKTYFQEHNYRQTPGYQYIVAMEVEARCLEHLCTANWLINLVFKQRELVKSPKSPYTTHELTYGLRLECFESVGLPQLPEYDAFLKECSIYDEDLALKTVKQNISGAQAFLKAISQVAGAKPEIEKLKRSAFGLSAMVLKLGKGVEKIKFVHQGNHPFFPVPTSI